MKHTRGFLQKIIKSKWIVAFMSFACILQMISCSEEPQGAAYFTLIDDSNGVFAKDLLVSPVSGVRTFTLISNRNWEISYDHASWIDISPSSGKGVATITVTVTPNDSLLKEDSIYFSIINNSLLVIENLKVKRQNYLATYNGKASITSPIDSICTTCTSTDSTSITSNSVLGFANGDTTLSFNTTIKLRNSFTMGLVFKGNAQTVTENGKVKFVYHGVGTFDFTPLGVIINDPSVTGVKNTIIEAELVGGLLSFQAVIDPDTNGLIKPDVSTVITFEGNR